MSSGPMQYWERALSTAQMGCLLIGLTPQKDKETLLRDLGTVLPTIGLQTTSLFAERTMLYYAIDDAASKGLMAKDRNGQWFTTGLGKLTLMRFRDLQTEFVTALLRANL